MESDAILRQLIRRDTASTLVAARDVFKRHIIVDTPLRRHRRHFIAKVFINVVFITIIVNTPPSPRPQDGHLASSGRLFCKTRRRRHQPRHPRLHRHGVTIVTTPTRPHGSGKTDVCLMGFLRSWQNRWTHRRRHPLTSARCIVHDCSSVIYNIAHFFAPPALCGFIIHDDYTIDHDYLDHGYITMIGYLDIDINGYVYSNSSATTPVNSVRVVTSVYATPAVTAGGNRGGDREGTRRGRSHRPRCRPIRDAVDDDAAEKATEAQDFKFSRNRPLHSRYD